MRFFKYFVVILLVLILLCALEVIHLDTACQELLASGLILRDSILSGTDAEAVCDSMTRLWERHRSILQLYMEPNLLLTADGALSRMRGDIRAGFYENAAESAEEFIDTIRHMQEREAVRWQNILSRRAFCFCLCGK